MTELIKKVNDELSEIISAEIDFGAEGIIGSNLTFSKDELAKIQNSLIRTEKYKWHDLRKNPEDLPDTVGQKMCFNGNEYRVIYAGSLAFDIFRKMPENPMIAWREIEPFEEVEE